MPTIYPIKTKRHRLLKRTLQTKSLIPLSIIVGQKVMSVSGNDLGEISDVIVKWDGQVEYPLVVGMTVSKADSERFLPISSLKNPLKANGHPQVESTLENLDVFRRRPGEIRLKNDVLKRQLVDVDGVRVLRAGELYLSYVLGRLRLVATSDLKPKIKFLRSKSSPVISQKLVDWAAVQPFGEPESELHLKLPHSDLKKLHPGELADIIEALDQPAKKELTESLDVNQAADALEEMEPDELNELLAEVNAEKAAEMLEKMEPDEAADALRDLDRSVADSIMSFISPPKAREIARLLKYPESMAGGFMTTVVLTVTPEKTVEDVRELLRANSEHASDLDGVVVINSDGILIGDVSLFDIAAADPQTKIADLINDTSPIVVLPEALLDEVMEQLTKSRRHSVVVVDEQGRPQGRVLADDIIDALREGSLRDRLPWILK